MIEILLGLLLAILFFMAIRTDLPEDEILLYYEEEDELLEDEILLYYDEEEEDLLDDEDEEV